MTVTCPNCKTTYNLADDKARPGVKLRCTVCRQVFVLPDSSAPEPPADIPAAPPVPSASDAEQELSISIGSPARPRKGSRKFGVFALVLVLLLGGGGADVYKRQAYNRAGYLAEEELGTLLRDLLKCDS